ncbi:hypothetical protein BDZ89DRAFT_924581, partial [Hymenopellis radicata]
TPSKRMRIMTAGLSASASGSFLVARSRLTGTQASALVAANQPVIQKLPSLPQPDWSLLTTPSHEYMTRDQMSTRIDELTKSLSRSKDFIDAQNYVIEGSQAQLIVQGMSLVRMKDSLWAKDTQKKSDKTKLFVDGKGQHLTSKEIQDAVRKGEEDKAVKLAEKLNRKEDREELKKKREEFDAWWTGIKEKHKEAVQKWQDQCKELTMQGLPKNHHPKKPKLMKK